MYDPKVQSHKMLWEQNTSCWLTEALFWLQVLRPSQIQLAFGAFS